MRLPVLALVLLGIASGCESGPASPAIPSNRGPSNAYGAYGPYPPPPDAPPAAWPTAAAPQGAPPPSAGCGKAAGRQGLLAGQRVRVGGGDRTFSLHVPEPYAPATAYPLVFVLHGNGGNGAGVRGQMDLERYGAARALFVYPDARGGGWDLDSEAAKNRDVAFFDMLLFTLGSTYCVDMKRVFVAGFSNGAYMANQLACRRGDRIRAIASHAGGGPYENNGRYDDEGHLVCAGKAVAALVVHGIADGTVGTGEGDKSVAHWRFANRCGGASQRTTPAGCELLGGCVQQVMSCRVPGLGHSVWNEGKAATWAFFDAQR